MAKDPAFLFYYQDFAHGTRRFTLEQKGLYIELLCEQADSKTGSIPISIFEEMCDNSEECKTVSDKFKVDENGYFNQVLRENLDKRRKYCESRRNNLKKKPHMEAHMEAHMDTHMENTNTNGNRDVVKDVKHKHGEFKNVLLTDEQFKTFTEKHGEELSNKAIDILSNYLITYKGGEKYKTHYAVLPRWPLTEAKKTTGDPF